MGFNEIERHSNSKLLIQTMEMQARELSAQVASRGVGGCSGTELASGL